MLIESMLIGVSVPLVRDRRISPDQCAQIVVERSRPTGVHETKPDGTREPRLKTNSIPVSELSRRLVLRPIEGCP